MKRLLTIVTPLFSVASLSNAQTGNWAGQLEVQGMNLTVVFHLDGEEPSMDSPDQAAFGIPIQVERTELGKITIRIPSLGASYEGQWLIKQIVGTFKQMTLSLPLTLTPEKPLNRPQTPKEPFPYTQEEVTFSNGDATLTGTLVLPEGCTRKTPVLIMVTGSGQEDRDETIFDHKPFAVLADVLGRAGIATLRYDDRGMGGSTGDVVNATTEDFRDDALAGIKLLRERFDKVGVIGHSEGGLIALMLAADKQADFIVSLAGVAVSGIELIVAQSRTSLEAAGYPELRPRLGDITCPVLALNGTKDIQVDCESNLSALREGLPANPRNRIEALEGLNHLFQHCTTGAVSEYRQIEETIAPEALEMIVAWLSD